MKHRKTHLIEMEFYYKDNKKKLDAWIQKQKEERNKLKGAVRLSGPPPFFIAYLLLIF